MWHPVQRIRTPSRPQIVHQGNLWDAFVHHIAAPFLPQAPDALKQCYSCASQHSAFSTLFLPRSFLVQLPQQDTFLPMPKRRMSSATRSISVTRGRYHQGDPVTTQSPPQRVAWIQVYGKGYDSHLHLLNPVKRTTCQFQQPAAKRIMSGVSAPSTNRKSCTIQSGMV